jgi:hypothetical protein
MVRSSLESLETNLVTGPKRSTWLSCWTCYGLIVPEHLDSKTPLGRMSSPLVAVTRPLRSKAMIAQDPAFPFLAVVPSTARHS